MRTYRIAALIGLVGTLVLSLAGPVSAHPISNSGDATVRSTGWIDFDGGGNTRDPSKRDLRFRVLGPNKRFLHPAPTTGIVEIGSSKPSYTTCKHASLVNEDYEVNAAVGKWFCFMTNQGRVVRFHVDSVNPYPGSVRLAWTTWQL